MTSDINRASAERPARVDLLDLTAAGANDVVRQREPGRELRILAVVTQRHHEEPVAERLCPSHDLVVIELGHRRPERGHLAVLVHLRLPARGRDGTDPVGAPDDRERSPIRVASAFAGFVGRGRPAPMLGRAASSSSTASVTSVAERRQDPHGLERPERREPEMPERGSRLEAGRDRAPSATPRSAASSAMRALPTSRRARGSRGASASGTRASVSAVFPEYDETHDERVRAAVLREHG